MPRFPATGYPVGQRFVAQMVEQPALNRRVAGSIPARPTSPEIEGTSPDVPRLVAAALSRMGRGCTSPINLSISLRRKHLISRD